MTRDEITRSNVRDALGTYQLTIDIGVALHNHIEANLLTIVEDITHRHARLLIHWGRRMHVMRPSAVAILQCKTR